MENTHGLRLRRAEKEDCRFLYELRNEEEVRKNSFQTGIFSYEDHVAWFERKLEEKKYTDLYLRAGWRAHRTGTRGFGRAEWRNFLCTLSKGKRTRLFQMDVRKH